MGAATARACRQPRRPWFEGLLTLGQAGLGGARIEQATAPPRPTSAGRRPAPSMAHAPSVIARKIAIGTSVSLLSIIEIHTLIATIFLITQAPISWPTAVAPASSRRWGS